MRSPWPQVAPPHSSAWRVSSSSRRRSRSLPGCGPDRLGCSKRCISDFGTSVHSTVDSLLTLPASLLGARRWEFRLPLPPSVSALLLPPHRHGGCTRIWASFLRKFAASYPGRPSSDYECSILSYNINSAHNPQVVGTESASPFNGEYTTVPIANVATNQTSSASSFDCIPPSIPDRY